MFKRLLRYSLIFISMFTIFLWTLFITTNENLRTAQRENDLSTNFTQLNIPIHTYSNKNYKTLISDIYSVSNKLKIPFLKRTWYQGHGVNKKVNYAHSIDDITFEVSNLSTTPLQKNFKTKFVTNKVYSTKKINGVIPLKKISSIDFTVKQLNYKDPNREGYFYIQSTNPPILSKFRKELANKINHSFQTTYTEQDFLPQTMPTIFNTNTYDLRQIALTFTIFQIIFLILFCILSSYDLGIYKLVGISNLSTAFNLYFPIFISTSITAAIICCFHLNIVQQIISATAIFLLSELFIVYLIVFILYKLPTNRLLIKRNYVKSIFYLLYPIKIVILIIIAMNLFPLGQSTYQYFKSRSQANNIFNDYGVFFPTSIGYNQADLTNPQYSSELDTKIIYPFATKKGALLINTTPQNPPVDNPYRSAQINTNYLKLNPLYTVSGKKIVINNTSSTPIVLLPQKYEHYKTIIAKNFINNNIGKSTNIKFIIIANNQKLIDEIGKKTDYYNYISVLTQNNLPTMINILTGDSREPLKIKLYKKSPSVVYKEYLPLLRQYNLTDNLPQLIKARDLPLNLMKQAMGNIQANIISIFMSIFTFIIIDIAIIYLFFSVYGKKYAIKKSLGISSFKYSFSYRLLWLLSAITTIISGSLILSNWSIELLLIWIILLFIDLVINEVGRSILSKSIIRRLLNE